MDWLQGIPDVAKAVGGDVAAFIAISVSSLAIIIRALRSNKAEDLAEVIRKNAALEQRVSELETKYDTIQVELVTVEHDRFVLRRVLAANGLADPTLEAS